MSCYVLVGSRSDARHFNVLSFLCTWMFVFIYLFIYFIKTPEFEEMGTTYTYNDTDNIITHMNT